MVYECAYKTRKTLISRTKVLQSAVKSDNGLPTRSWNEVVRSKMSDCEVAESLSIALIIYELCSITHEVDPS